MGIPRFLPSNYRLTRAFKFAIGYRSCLNILPDDFTLELIMIIVSSPLIMHRKGYTPYVTTTCIQCSCELPATSPSHRKFCSGRCKARYRKIHGCDGKSGEGHQCRECGTLFPIGPGQHNKWLCSDECRRKSAKRSIREFHGRRPQ